MSGACMRERGREGGRVGGEGERKFLLTECCFQLLQVLYVDAYQCYWYVHSIVCTYFHALVYKTLLLTGSHVPSGPWMVPGRHRQPLQASHSALGKLDRLPVYTHVYKNTHNLTYKYVKIHGFLILTHKMINIH